MLKSLQKRRMLRRLIAKLTESVNQAYEASQPADEIIAQAEKGLIDVSEMQIEVDLRIFEMC